jgi:hypothetical protein
MSGALLSFQQNTVSGSYPAIAMTIDSVTPGINVFKFSGGQIGVKYSSPVIANFCFQVAWAKQGTTLTDIAVTSSSFPYINVWAWNYNSGFGSKYTDPASFPSPAQARGVDFFSDGTNVYDIAITQIGTPFVYAYPWTSGVGFGSLYADPAILPGGGAVNFRYNVSGSQVAVTQGSSPYVNVYPWTTGVGFGSKYADPATLPTGAGRSVEFSDSQIAVAHNNSPYVSVYPFSTAGGFGTKWANPVTLPTGNAYDVSWYNLGSEAIAVAHDNSPYVSVYPFSTGSGFGSKYADPVTLPTGSGRSVDFTDGVASGVRSLAVGHDTSPYVSVYPFSLVSGIGTKSADFTTLPAGNVLGVKFSPNS